MNLSRLRSAHNRYCHVSKRLVVFMCKVQFHICNEKTQVGIGFACWFLNSLQRHDMNLR